MFKFRLFFIAYLLILLLTLYSDESVEDIKTLKEERLEIILFGIDSQVSDLITKLEEEKNYDFNSNFVSLLKSSSNSRLDVDIIKLLNASKDNSAVEYSFFELQENYNLNDDIKIEYIKYISEYQTEQISEYFLSLIDEKSNSISIAAITALGKSDEDDIIPTLIENLEDSLFDDIRKPAIIESLGKLKAIESLEILTDIATDIYSEDDSLRWRAVVAIGEIASPKSLPVLKSLFSDSDPFLRNYTITALKHYETEEVEDIIIQGLKDSSWRVRVNAAQILGELQIKEAIPILIYKSENDPDIRNVRSAALNALGEIGEKESFEFIRKLYKNKRTNIGLRSIAIKVLAEKDLINSLETIESVIKEEWDESKPAILDYTCKILSTTKNSSLKDLYSKMLLYDKTLNLKLYALRGIRLNSITSLKPEVEKLTEDEIPNAVRKLALDVFKEL
jgi:HEAT repeat protein